MEFAHSLYSSDLPCQHWWELVGLSLLFTFPPVGAQLKLIEVFGMTVSIDSSSNPFDALIWLMAYYPFNLGIKILPQLLSSGDPKPWSLAQC